MFDEWRIWIHFYPVQISNDQSTLVTFFLNFFHEIIKISWLISLLFCFFLLLDTDQQKSVINYDISNAAVEPRHT